MVAYKLNTRKVLVHEYYSVTHHTRLNEYAFDLNQGLEVIAININSTRM